MYQGKTIPKREPTPHEVYYEIDGCIMGKAIIRSSYEECKKYMREYLDRYNLKDGHDLCMANCNTGRLVSVVW